MFQSKKPNSSRGVRHARKFRLRTDASRNTRCSRALNTQLPRVIAERAIHHVQYENFCASAQPTLYTNGTTQEITQHYPISPHINS